MRVLVNEICTWDGAKTGVGHYTAGLVGALKSLSGLDIAHYPPAWVGLAVAGWKSCRRWLPRRKPSSAAGQAPVICRTTPRLSLKHRLLQRHFARACRRGRYEVYHEPNFIPFACDLPTVLTIHDLSVLLHPEWHPIERVRDHERHFQRGLAQCSHILTVSEFTRREVMTALGYPPERVTRTYNGVRRTMRPLPPEDVRPVLRRLRLPPQYLLHVGTIEPRKNLLMLLRAYAGLPAKLRKACPLVLVGGWGWNHGEVAEFLRTRGAQLGVIHVGYLAEHDLPAVYNGARALVFPSLYEGFGLPAVEMLACGGAVLASTAEVFVELLAGQAHLIGPHDADGWRAAMQRAIVDAEWRQTLQAGAVRHAARFTWEACAADTVASYRAVTAGRPVRHMAQAG